MPQFVYRSHYPHPRAEVFAWHARPGGAVRLMPPGWTRIVEGPTNGIEIGSELVTRMLPLGVRWRARHVQLDPGRLFVDEQVSGPLRRWRHEHHFEDGPDGSTTIVDVVEWEGWPFDRILIEERLRRLFGFRARQLRADLAVGAAPGAAAARVLVAGASGVIGTQVCALLGTLGHDVTRLVRREVSGPGEVTWDPDRGYLPGGALDGVDVVINLAGHSIAGRFTQQHKRRVLDSRLKTTRLLAEAVARAGQGALVQASAVGIYGPRRPGENLTEESALGDGFLAEVGRAWEEAADPARAAGARTVTIRTPVALSMAGGALPPQVPLYLVGLGGRLTKPDAWLSWITVDDLARVYAHAALGDLAGPVNAVTAHPVTHAAFAAALGRALRRPAWLPTPALGPMALLGREGYDQFIDTDHRVCAGKLTGSGFDAAEPELAGALRHVLVR